MIARQHLFDDIIGGSTGVYHSAILTCYSFDPLFFANYYRSNLNARGIRNQILLIDASKLDEVKEEEAYSYIEGVSPFEGYTPLRIQCNAGGVFHPKIGLFIGEKKLLLVVGSGNLTYSGMSFNNEAWGAFCAGSDDPPEARMIASAWRYLSSIIANQKLSTSDMQVSWMLDNSPLLRSILAKEYADGFSEADSAGDEFMFSANAPGTTIMDTIVSAIGSEHVKKVSVCSPFYDNSGTAITELLERLSPDRVDCVVEELQGTLPYGFDRGRYPNVHFYADEEDKHRYTHAKLVQVISDTKTVLAIGSANASKQALGHNGQYCNDEADIIVRSNKHIDYLKELGIVRTKELSDFSAVKPIVGKDQTKSLSKEVAILCSELLQDGLHVRLDKQVSDVDLVVIDAFKQTFVSHLSVCDQDVTIALPDDFITARTVFLSRAGKTISNRSVVVIKSEIDGKNPDKEHASIAKLLDNATDGRGFEELLQYVHIEEETKLKFQARGTKVSSSDESKQSEGKVIKDEDFEDRVYRHRLDAIEQANERILDKIAAAAFATSSSRMTKSHSEDEVTSAADRESGNNVTNDDSDATPTEISALDEARGYLRRLLKYYARICAKFDGQHNPDFDEGKAVGLLSTKSTCIRRKTNLDYSSVNIALFEMCKVAREGRLDEVDELYDFFIRIVGRFLLIFREDPEGVEPDAPTMVKIKKKQKNLFVYSILLSCYFECYGADEMNMRLLILNLLDSYSNHIDELKEALDLFENKLEQHLFIAEERGVALVRACAEQYFQFAANRNVRMIELQPYMDWAILHKKSFGFVYVKNIIRKRASSINPFELRLSAFAPGFVEYQMDGISHGSKAIAFETK